MRFAKIINMTDTDNTSSLQHHLAKLSQQLKSQGEPSNKGIHSFKTELVALGKSAKSGTDYNSSFQNLLTTLFSKQNISQYYICLAGQPKSIHTDQPLWRNEEFITLRTNTFNKMQTNFTQPACVEKNSLVFIAIKSTLSGPNGKTYGLVVLPKKLAKSTIREQVLLAAENLTTFHARQNSTPTSRKDLPSGAIFEVTSNNHQEILTLPNK